MGAYTRMRGCPEEPEDNTPLEMPLGRHRPLSLQDFIARSVRDALAAESGEDFETWEESDDFEEDDPDTLDFSRYELHETSLEPAIRDFGPDPDGEFASAGVGHERGSQTPSEAPKETISGQPDPNVEPMKE